MRNPVPIRNNMCRLIFAGMQEEKEISSSGNEYRHRNDDSKPLLPNSQNYGRNQEDLKYI